MSDQIVLAFTVSTAGTIFTPAQAATKLAAVPLYANPQTDPVLGQIFGLTVASDVTAPTAGGATRTLTLNMTAAVGAPFAPPPFPCRPVGPIPPKPPTPPILDGELQDVVQPPTPPPNPPPQPPYALVDASTQRSVALKTGSPAGVYTSTDVVPPRQIVIEADVDLQSDGTSVYPAGTTIVVGQPAPGTPNEFTPTPIDATVAAITKVFQATIPVPGKPIEATVSAPGGGGGTANVTVTIALARPAKIVAIFSTSALDTAGVPALVTPIPPGPGAQSVSLSYLDSTGAGPFTVVTPLLGKFPAQVALAGGSIDVAVITDMHVVATGGFKNSIGQITLSELSAPTAVIQPNVDFQEQQDAAQLLLSATIFPKDGTPPQTPRALAYLPPSYFALTQQGAATPQLAGDFLVTTGSPVVTTTEDQTGALAPTDTVRFASQQDTDYTVKSVTFAVTGKTGILTLTSPYTGYDKNKIDSDNEPRPTNQTAHAQKQPTGAVRVTPSPAAPPPDAALAVAVGQFVGPAGTATPPPPPPNPVVLSDIFTQAISLALAARVTPAPITFI